MGIITYKDVENKIMHIRHMQVIVDSDVAEMYQVGTKEVNQAVSRNKDKFPDGYIIELSQDEKKELVTNCDRFDTLKHSTSLPKAFTEKGLYMLATILKSPVATQTTLLIIDTFAKVRELGRVISQVQVLPENSPKQKALMERTGDIITDLIVPDDDLELVGTETTVEMNFAVFKIKRTVRKESKKENPKNS